MLLGPLMTDLSGLTLTPDDKEIIKHPQLGGLILFSKNYENSRQLKSLILEIQSIRPELLLAVDQEGGQVQRFKSHGFTKIPTPEKLFHHYLNDPSLGIMLSVACGLIIGFELYEHNIDINFAPVLDIHHGKNAMLKSRCFGQTAEQVSELSLAYLHGLQLTEIKAVGKHFPGHGFVKGDTHISLPKDERTLETIQLQDLKPFKEAIDRSIPGIMPAHVLYPEIDQHSPTFSSFWLQNILRQQLNFKGLVFSDCLNMSATSIIGDFKERTKNALASGCDMAVICNNRAGAKEALEWLSTQNINPTQSKKLSTMKKNKMEDFELIKTEYKQSLLLLKHHGYLLED